MANDEGTPAGFLSRWSRRKVDVREGRSLDEPHAAKAAVDSSPATLANSQPERNAASGTSAAPPQPGPTLAEAQQLTPESDFTSFMARGVAPDVKNAAMKQLFSDPHFNVMDRLDIYIDDYSQPDPLPLAMLRQMTSAKTLNLFDDTPDETVDHLAGDTPTDASPKVVAQSDTADIHSNPEPHTHDHADLRLQPDPTTRPEGPEPKPV
jgi:hypothetical protein